MAEIKDLGAIQEKWGRVTPQRTEDYKIGIKAPKRDWQQASVAAKDTHKAAMVDAAAKDSFAKGITKAGSARWQSKALAKGPARFAEGVMVGAPDFGAGFAPYREVIAGVVLPPRYPRRDPRNIARVQAIDSALAKAKAGA